MNKLTLEQLLRMKIAGTSPVTGKAIQYPPEFRVAVQNETEDGVHIIVHANGHNSETLDFIVKGNELIDYNDYQWWSKASANASETEWVRQKALQEDGALVLAASGTFDCPICTRDTPHHHDLDRKWIGVDFDHTLAHHPEDRDDPYTLGEPIPEMVTRVKEWIAKGYKVKILTARMASFSYSSHQQRDVERMEKILQDWCVKHLGVALECTNEKDGNMEVLWDDRAVQVIAGTGKYR